MDIQNGLIVLAPYDSPIEALRLITNGGPCNMKYVSSDWRKRSLTFFRVGSPFYEACDLIEYQDASGNPIFLLSSWHRSYFLDRVAIVSPDSILAKAFFRLAVSEALDLLLRLKLPGAIIIRSSMGRYLYTAEVDPCNFQDAGVALPLIEELSQFFQIEQGLYRLTQGQDGPTCVMRISCLGILVKAWIFEYIQPNEDVFINRVPRVLRVVEIK
ncbi:MAG TPA: hypothetical protein V6D07_18635 [Trichocoleus sp.]